ncbi:MAG: hypothetical protein RLZ55_1742, partial [Actinomycetota bacterium]
MQAGSGASGRTRRSLDLTAVAVGALWIGALAVAAPLQSAAFASWPAAIALLAAEGLAWLGLVLRVLSVRPYVVLLAALGLAQVANSSPDGPPWAITSTVVLAALSAGLLLGIVVARRWIAALAGATGAVYVTVLLAHHSPWPYWAAGAFHIVHVLADGLLAAAVAGMLVGVAARRDALASQAATRHALAARREQARNDRVRMGRLLHDTVANTLTAVRRGVAVDQVPPLQRRCTEDLAVIDAALTSPVEAPAADDLGWAVRRVVAERRVPGLQVDVQVDGAWARLPAETIESFAAIVGEALTNAGKHGAQTAHVRTAATATDRGSAAGGVVVTVTDDGPGIADAAIARRLQSKFQVSYAAPGDVACQLAGRASGTVVTATWNPPPPRGADTPDGSSQPTDQLSLQVRTRMRVVTLCVLALACVDLSVVNAVDQRFQATPTLLVYAAMLAGLLLLRRLIARADSEAADEQQAGEQEAVAEARARERALVRAAYLRGAITVSRPLLAALAEGRADPRSQDVIQRCAVVECYVRSLLMLAPHQIASPLAAAMAEVAGAAQSADVQLTVMWAADQGTSDVPDPRTIPAPDHATVSWIAQALSDLVAASP